jgi:uncharacterized protein (TIGR02266 family)
MASLPKEREEQASAEADSRREHRRHPLEVSVDLVSDHNFYTGLTQNISAGGLYVSTNVLRRIGERLRVKLTLPGSTKPLELETEVRWVKDVTIMRDAEQGMGLRFVDLSEEASKAIAAFIAKRDSIFFDDE